MTDTASFNNTTKKETAYVVFQGGVDQTIPLPLSSPGWRHCWVMLPVYYPEPGLMAHTFTNKIELLRWGYHSAVWWRPPEVCAAAFMEAGATAIVEFPYVSPPSPPRPVWRGPMTCVTLTKAVLQIDAWKVWTPKQLYRYLIRNGGRLYGEVY